jgi:hypothetical protein
MFIALKTEHVTFTMNIVDEGVHDNVRMVEKPQPLCTFRTLRTHMREWKRERTQWAECRRG